MPRSTLPKLALAAFAACLSLSPSFGEDFYQGKTIKLIVGASPTGGYNLYARTDRKSTRLNSSHIQKSRMPSSA